MSGREKKRIACLKASDGTMQSIEYSMHVPIKHADDQSSKIMATTIIGTVGRGLERFSLPSQ